MIQHILRNTGNETVGGERRWCQVGKNYYVFVVTDRILTTL